MKSVDRKAMAHLKPIEGALTLKELNAVVGGGAVARPVSASYRRRRRYATGQQEE